MKNRELIAGLAILVATFGINCSNQNTMNLEVYETSEAGNQLTELTEFTTTDEVVEITLNPDEKFQKITGFGGSFTESSAYLLNQLSDENRKKIIEAYFGESGAKYSLTRTHINSSDFSLGNYSYAPVPGDVDLENFSIEEDMDDIIPMIKDAMAVSEDGFKIISSPWTAPIWISSESKHLII